VVGRNHRSFNRLTLFGAADDQLFPGITGKSYFIVVAILVLDQKTVVPEQGINFLREK
jgi:hypothetical protein